MQSPKVEALGVGLGWLAKLLVSRGCFPGQGLGRTRICLLPALSPRELMALETRGHLALSTLTLGCVCAA